MDVSLYAATLDDFCNRLVDNPRVVDLACGPGNLSRYVLDRRPDVKLLGLDLAPNMVALAKQNNPEAEFVVMDCRAITLANTLATPLTEPFDALTCGFVLPYLTSAEVLSLFDAMHQVVKADGLIYLSTMTGKPADSGLQTSSSGQQMYIHYHEEARIIHALQEAGLISSVTAIKL